MATVSFLSDLQSMTLPDNSCSPMSLGLWLSIFLLTRLVVPGIRERESCVTLRRVSLIEETLSAGSTLIKLCKLTILTCRMIINMILKYSDRSASAPVAQQGGGLIDATKLLSSKTRFSPNKLALNHTGNFQGADAKIQLTNTGTSTVIYNVTHIPGISFYVYGDDHLSIETSFPGEDSIFKDKFATAKFSTSVIELKPGAKKSVNIAFGVPTGFIQRRVPIYGGHIAFRGNNGEDLFVPYSGESNRCQKYLFQGHLHVCTLRLTICE